MKGFKSILAVAILAALTVSFSASAQENANRDENGNVVRGAYETNGIWDNWFLDLGAGINTLYDDGFQGQMGLATQLNIGKWFTPTVGARLGWSGMAVDATASHQFVGTRRPHVAFNYIHGDALVNLSNLFSGYKETRFWDVIVYPTFGVGITGNGAGQEFTDNFKNNEYLGGAGLINEFRLGERVNANLDIRGLIGRAQAYSRSGLFCNFLTVTAGVSIALGDKVNFDRHSSITPVVIPVPFTVDQYNDLAKKVADLEKENAALKNKIAELEAREPEIVYVDKGVATPAAIYFDLGSTTISAREQAHLEYFADNVDKDKELEVVGSADMKPGSQKRNEYLANERANAVKKALVKAGFDESKISTCATIDTAGPNPKSRVATIKVK